MPVMEIAIISPPSQVDYTSRIERQLNTTTVTHHKPQEEELPAIADPDGVIIAGSTEHIYTDLPWIGTMADRVQKILREGTPVLGVCFGHQFLADILGGKVTCLDSRKVGFNNIHLTDSGIESPIFRGFNDRLIGFEWHKDIVAELPDRAVALARNENGIQGFSSTTLPAYGVQFHPECRKEMIDEILSNLDNDGMCETIRRTCTTQTIRCAARTFKIYNNFVNNICRSAALKKIN